MSSNRSLTILAFLAVCGVLYFASALLIPIAGALFLSLLFLPFVRRMGKRGIPAGLSSVVIVIFLTVILVSGLLALGEAAKKWAEQAPETIDKIEQKVKKAKGPLTELTEATSKLEDIAKLPSGSGNRVVDVESGFRSGEILGRVFSGSLSLILGLAVCLVLTLFILASGDVLERNIMEAAPDFRTKRRYLEAKRELEVVLGRFLTARSVINLCLGLVLWPIFYFLGVGSPLLWAATAAILNYIPYVGSVIMVVLLIAAGMVSEETVLKAVQPALAFMAVNSIEGMVISPIIIGRWMQLNAIAVFLSVVIFGWFWGIAGALMAVPLLIAFCTICKLNDQWSFLGHLIAGTKYVPPGNLQNAE